MFIEETLGAICARENGIIQTGPFGSQLHEADYVEQGLPVIMPKDIINGQIMRDSVARIEESKADQLSRHKLKIGAVVMPRRGEINKRAFITEKEEGWLCGTGCIKIELKGKELLPKFFYYYLQQSSMVGWIEKKAVGTTMLNLNTSIIRNIPIKRPPLETQKRIAEILSAYDDLIENNLKRIRLLEESARLLYREWFVRLKFPNHEHTRIIDGLPDGWERKTLADVCESINYGYTASATQEEIGAKFLRITDIVPPFIDWSSVPNCEITNEKKKQFLLKEGDIVVARTGATVGYAKRLHKRHPDTVFASYLVRLRIKKDVDNLMIGIFVESDDYKSYIQSNLSGSAQPNANAKVISNVTILIPPVSIQKLFREIVEATFDQREILTQQNQKLKQARDLLLPRLMSGEMAV